jgi:hypothetical protein
LAYADPVGRIAQKNDNRVSPCNARFVAKPEVTVIWITRFLKIQQIKVALTDHGPVETGPPAMKHKPRHRTKGKRARRSLRLPDLEHAKAAVLNSLTSADAQRGYLHAIDEFVYWYCSEPPLAFNRTVVTFLGSFREHLAERTCGLFVNQRRGLIPIWRAGLETSCSAVRIPGMM